MLSRQLTATISLVIASFIWGTAFVAQTTGMDFIGPLTFINIRFLIGVLVILPFFLIERNVLFKVDLKRKNRH